MLSLVMRLVGVAVQPGLLSSIDHDVLCRGEESGCLNVSFLSISQI